MQVSTDSHTYTPMYIHYTGNNSLLMLHETFSDN